MIVLCVCVILRFKYRHYLSSYLLIIIIYDKGNSHCEICHFCLVGYLCTFWDLWYCITYILFFSTCLTWSKNTVKLLKITIHKHSYFNLSISEPLEKLTSICSNYNYAFNNCSNGYRGDQEMKTLQCHAHGHTVPIVSAQWPKILNRNRDRAQKIAQILPRLHNWLYSQWSQNISWYARRTQLVFQRFN